MIILIDLFILVCPQLHELCIPLYTLQQLQNHELIGTFQPHCNMMEPLFVWSAIFVLRGPLFTETLDSMCLSKAITFSSHLHSFEIGSWYVTLFGLIVTV